jgi:hypothetical protein
MRVILADISTKTIEPKSLNTVKDFKLSEENFKKFPLLAWHQNNILPHVRQKNSD